EEHHGRLAVTHDDAAGTTITAALPVRAVAAGPTPAEVDRAAGSPPLDATLAGRRLLLVDDDEDARETLAALLRARGAEIDAFADGPSALEHLRRQAVD